MAASSRDEFDDFFDGEDDKPVTDTRADGRLYRVPIARLSPNLVNPRTDFGTEDQLIDLGKSLARRQNQPCPVVSRSAYLKLWPDHAEQVGDVDYVLVSGERRYRGADAVGLLVLDCVANDAFADDRKTFMEAVVSENVDRQNFDPIEEAYAVRALVAEFGSNRAVAQHFDRVDGWITQRVLLTHLDPQMQTLVRQKDIPLEAARSLGKLARDKDWSAQEQMAWWLQERERRAVAAASRAAVRKAGRDSPDGPPRPPTAPTPPAPSPQTQPVPPANPAQPQKSFTAVKHEATPLPTGSGGSAGGADGKATQPTPPSPPANPPAARPPAVPEPRPDTGQTVGGPVPDPPVVRMPWDDGQVCAEIAIAKMERKQRLRMVERLLTQQLKEQEEQEEQEQRALRGVSV